jgi:hypothetical protein
MVNPLLLTSLKLEVSFFSTTLVNIKLFLVGTNSNLNLKIQLLTTLLPQISTTIHHFIDSSPFNINFSPTLYSNSPLVALFFTGYVSGGFGI